MKKFFISAILTSCFALASFGGFAQKQKVEKNKSKEKEIIIRSNGDADNKMTIEINGDKVTVNGKPLAEYHNGDVSIIARDWMERDSHNFLMTPPGGNMAFDFFNEEAKNPMAFLGVISEKANDGVKINEVLKESSAEKAGLKEGDVITKVDDKTINTPEDLMEAIRAHKPSDEVNVFYKRNDKTSDVKVKLGANKQRVRVFKNFRNGNDSGDSDNYNFRMPPMPDMQHIPNYNFRNFRNNNVKMGVKVEDAENNTGAKVLEVEAGSAAEKAGVKKDDIITEMNGEKVNDVNDLRSELMNGRDKESYTLKVKRNNSLQTFEMKIPKPVNSANL